MWRIRVLAFRSVFVMSIYHNEEPNEDIFFVFKMIANDWEIFQAIPNVSSLFKNFKIFFQLGILMFSTVFLSVKKTRISFFVFTRKMSVKLSVWTYQNRKKVYFWRKWWDFKWKRTVFQIEMTQITITHGKIVLDF